MESTNNEQIGASEGYKWVEGFENIESFVETITIKKKPAMKLKLKANTKPKKIVLEVPKVVGLCPQTTKEVIPEPEPEPEPEPVKEDYITKLLAEANNNSACGRGFEGVEPLSESEDEKLDEAVSIVSEREEPLEDEDEDDRLLREIMERKKAKSAGKVNLLRDDIKQYEEQRQEEMNDLEAQLAQIRSDINNYRKEKEAEIFKLTGEDNSACGRGVRGVPAPKEKKFNTTTEFKKNTNWGWKSRKGGIARPEGEEPSWTKKYTPEQYAKKITYDRTWKLNKEAGIPFNKKQCLLAGIPYPNPNALKLA